jgi:hypothetical protein
LSFGAACISSCSWFSELVRSVGTTRGWIAAQTVLPPGINKEVCVCVCSTAKLKDEGVGHEKQKNSTRKKKKTRPKENSDEREKKR